MQQNATPDQTEDVVTKYTQLESNHEESIQDDFFN